jgi:predicted nucleic acid-binding protein
MTVVSDTTTVTTLLKGELEDLLARLFGEIQVPESVHDELLAFHDRLPDFIRVVPLSGSAPWRLNVLGRGETDAIHLAQQLRADLFLSDDRKARVAAKEAGLACRGILGIFLQAKKAGMIDSVAAAIRQVESKGGLYLSEAVKLEALRLAGE